MAGEVGSLMESTRGFLADTLGRFAEVAQRREQERSDPVRLGTYIGGQLDPMGRFGQIRTGLPGGTMWGTGAMGTIPGLDYLSQHGTPFRNPYDRPKDDSGFALPGQNTGPGSYPNPGPAPSPSGGSNQAATSADNSNLTGTQINDWIAKTRGNAPIAGMGDYILQVANQYGVSAPLMLGIFLKESELGVTAGPNKVISGITGPGDQGLGGQRAFQGFATWQDAIAATAANLATGIYKGKSINEQIGSWYVGPQEYAARGLGATDKAGNGTVGDYVNLVAGVYNALGVPFNAAQPAQTVAPQGGGNYSGSATGVASLFGGGSYPLTQDFNAHEPGLADVYDFGNQYGMDGDGHTGWDIGAPDGTAFYMPQGLTGKVTIAGGSGYYRDETGRHDPNTSGEIRITLSNGYELILGHNSQINVRVGQQVNAGDLLGLTGTANGPHLHVEVRMPDRGTPSGWRIVNPSVLFAPATGGGGQNY